MSKERVAERGGAGFQLWSVNPIFMNLKRFTNVKNLRGLGRPLLKRFFDKFDAELKGCKVKLPPDSLTDDDAYYQQLAEVFYAPKELPARMVEALDVVLEMANDKGVDRLCAAAREKGLKIDWVKQATQLDIVMQVLLADEALTLEKHSEHHLLCMIRFHYWGTRTPPAERLPFTAPTDAAMELIRQAVDRWCRDNHRGTDTVAVTKHLLEDEWVFSIQHGGTMARLAEIKENPKTETLFYRPGKDDVVVYNVERDDLRIRAGSKGEEKLYQAEFGLRLRGDPAYFSERKYFTLDPLYGDLARALDTEGLPDIEYIKLLQVVLSLGGEFDDYLIKKSDDLVLSAAEMAKKGLEVPVIPPGGRLISATFEIKLKAAKTAGKVKLSIPDTLNVGRSADRKAVENWVTRKHFRAVAKPEPAA